LQKVAEAEGWNYRQVAWDALDGYYVSTVLLGTNFALGGRRGMPMIFETLAFVNEYEERELPTPWAGEGMTHRFVIHPPLDQFMRRYATKRTALIGHTLVCEELRQMIQQTRQVTER